MEKVPKGWTESLVHMHRHGDFDHGASAPTGGLDQKKEQRSHDCPKTKGPKHDDQDLRSGQKPHDQKRSDCPNHSVCQKKKAENECFQASVRQRFGSILRQWKIDSDLKHKIVEIIELILSKDIHIKTPVHDPRLGLSEQNCETIHQINNYNKLQFYKINFFIESLEKSRISPIHIHRIHIFLQTQIFDHLPIQEFFEQMLSVESLYRCEASRDEVPCKARASGPDQRSEASGAGSLCTTSVPVDTDLSEISKLFYIHIPTICKLCYHKNHIQTFGANRSKDAKASSKELRPDGSGQDATRLNVLKPLTKMYLCMKCGEDNYANFYERNKSKCRFCILAEKRGLDAEAIFTLEHKLAPSASKSHHCKHCHTEDPKNFREGYKSLCYACFLEEKKEKDRKKKEDLLNGKSVSQSSQSSYFCKDCETDLPYKFRRGYKTQCYECFLKEKKRDYEKQVQSKVLEPVHFSGTTGTLRAPPRDIVPCVLRPLVPEPSVLCKYCKDTNPVNFTEGMQTLCARCEELESEAYICKTCHLECLRNCFSEEQLAKPVGERVCNLCDPVAIAALAAEKARKTYHCETCNETRPEEFYSGSKGKCKTCTKEGRKWRYRAESSKVSDRR